MQVGRSVRHCIVVVCQCPERMRLDDKCALGSADDGQIEAKYIKEYILQALVPAVTESIKCCIGAAAQHLQRPMKIAERRIAHKPRQRLNSLQLDRMSQIRAS